MAQAWVPTVSAMSSSTAPRSITAARGFRPAIPPLCAGVGGAAIALGACLPWMYYFAGLVPLRGLIGLNGRLLLAAGAVAVALALPPVRAAIGRESRWRACSALIGATVSAGSVWLLIGVWELTHARSSNAMLAPKPGSGLWVVLFGGVLVIFAAAVPSGHTRYLVTASAPFVG
jgi:hypothetical protein